MPSNGLIRFGVFELDLTARELRKRGVRVKLQDQPFRVLEALVEKPGEIVTREELKDRLWAQDEFVEFDKSLNTAVQKIRQALGDSAESPRFLETIPRVGYKFIAPLTSAGPAVPPAQSPRKRPAPLWIGTGLAAVLLALTGFFLGTGGESGIDEPPRRFVLPAERDPVGAMISPDGRWVAYTTGGTQRARQATLWLQDLQLDEPRRIAGPGRAGWVAWAPDSEEIAYVQDATLYRLSPGGGDPIPIASLDVPTLGAGSWSPDGSTILAAPSLGDLRLIEIQVQGGEQEVVLAADEPRIEGSFREPQYLPDHRKIVYVRIDGARRTIMAADLETGQNTAIGEGRSVVYSPSGHLLFWRSRTDAGLWVVPFSAEKLIATGPPFRFRPSGRYPTVAEDGTLAYLDTDGGRAQLIWTDRRGVEVETVGQEQRSISSPQLSPDGMRVLVAAREEGQQTSVWVHHVERGSKTRLTFDSFADRAVWRPDGRAFAYTGPGPGLADILWRTSDGTGDPKLLASAPFPEFPYSWTKDGRFLLFNRNEALGDLWRVEVSEDGRALSEHPVLLTEFEEYGPVLSPDDRYLAYSSDKSGRHEVYVCPFPACDRQYLVSTKGGQQPRWRSDGREMYYVDPEGTLFAVPVDNTSAFTAGAPERLFDAETLRGRGHRYDVTPDGQRFLVVKQIEPTRRVIRVVDNWFSELRELQEGAP